MQIFSNDLLFVLLEIGMKRGFYSNLHIEIAVNDYCHNEKTEKNKFADMQMSIYNVIKPLERLFIKDKQA